MGNDTGQAAETKAFAAVGLLIRFHLSSAWAKRLRQMGIIELSDPPQTQKKERRGGKKVVELNESQVFVSQILPDLAKRGLKLTSIGYRLKGDSGKVSLELVFKKELDNQEEWVALTPGVEAVLSKRFSPEHAYMHAHGFWNGQDPTGLDCLELLAAIESPSMNKTQVRLSLGESGFEEEVISPQTQGDLNG